MNYDELFKIVIVGSSGVGKVPNSTFIIISLTNKNKKDKPIIQINRR